MAKPICLIYFPTDYSFNQSGLKIAPLELMKELNGWMDRRIDKLDDDAYGGYMYWIFTKEGITEPTLEVFNTDKLQESEYNNLLDLVKNAVEKIK